MVERNCWRDFITIFKRVCPCFRRQRPLPVIHGNPFEKNDLALKKRRKLEINEVLFFIFFLLKVLEILWV